MPKHAVSFITLGLAVFLSSCGAAPPTFDENLWKTKIESQRTALLYTDHLDDGVFFNPWMPMQSKSFKLFLKWRLSKKRAYTEDEKTHLPEVIPNLYRRIKNIPDRSFIAWIGHATFLIRTNGTYWLTDPMLSKRALLPKRVRPPALSFESLKQISDPINVLISHNHYDHLDKKTVQALPQHARIFVPMGLKKYVQSFFKGEVQAMDWWDRLDLGKGTQLVCLPAQHWSRRIGQDVNTTLWASYMMITPQGTIYYGGDSGYFAGYREFGKKYPGIDYALIPLTAYHPRWFMHYAHMNAAESIQAFNDLGARHYIPTQWGTFELGDNPPGYPALDLARTIEKMNLDPQRFIVLDIGEIVSM